MLFLSVHPLPGLLDQVHQTGDLIGRRRLGQLVKGFRAEPPPEKGDYVKGFKPAVQCLEARLPLLFATAAVPETHLAAQSRAASLKVIMG